MNGSVSTPIELGEQSFRQVCNGSPYSAQAANYRENGLSVIPCADKAKFPGTYTSAYGWRPASGWQKYCDDLPSDFEMSIWDKWPDAGICLALGPASAPPGMQLVAVDIDTDEPIEVAAIKSALPGSPVSKRGAKGETQFYLASMAVENKPFNNANKRRLLDLLCNGRQTVMPPSQHPDCPACGTKSTVGADNHCGECGAEGYGAYRWLTIDTLEGYAVADLPILPDDIVERLTVALAPFGYQAPEVHAPGSADLGIDSPHRSLNDIALGNLDAWVPSLALHGCTRSGRNYKAVAHWRPSSSGRMLSKRKANLSISPDGIRDFGDDKPYTPIDLLMVACGADLDTAFRWLQERVAPSKPVNLRASAPVASSEPEDEENEVWRPVRRKGTGNLRLIWSGCGKAEVQTVTQSSASEGDTNSTAYFDLEIEPGLLGDLARFSQTYAYRPVREFALPAALSVLAALFGRRWATPTGLGLNLYMIGLAPTGTGKEALIGAPSAILHAATFSHLIGPGDFTSDSAIEMAIRARPNFLASIDEIGEFVGSAQHRMAANYSKSIRKALLDLYGKSRPDGRWTGKQKADREQDKASIPVFAPTLSILGASTGTGFFDALTEANLSDGFINRFIVVQATSAGARQRSPERIKPPKSLIDGLRTAYDNSQPSGNLAAVSSRDATVAPCIQTVQWADDDAIKAISIVEDWEDEARNEGREGIVARAAENTQKVASLRALARNPSTPTVTAGDVAWAWHFVRSSIEAMERAALENMGGTDFSRIVDAARKAIGKAGPTGITRRDLLRAAGLRGKEDKQIEPALKRLETLGEIYSGMWPGSERGARPTQRYRLLAFDEG
jgi:hypothetical protein